MKYNLRHLCARYATLPSCSRLALQVRKMLQLKEALDQRMGCVIVGPSGCGKSTLWSILRNSMIKCGQAVNTHVVNPKSMPRQVCRYHRVRLNRPTPCFIRQFEPCIISGMRSTANVCGTYAAFEFPKLHTFTCVNRVLGTQTAKHPVSNGVRPSFL